MEKEYLIKKWLADELSQEELEAFRKLEDYDLMRAIVSDASLFKAPVISDTAPNEDRSLRTHTNTRLKRRAPWLKRSLRIAAVLTIAAGLYYFFLYDPKLEYQTLAGEKTSIILPDASNVVLNAGSTLKYRKKHWKDDRQVELVGEAYFKVEKGSTFQVLTGNGLVTVLGTSFNVNQRGSYFEVDCYEGSVSIRVDTLQVKLVAGTFFRMSKGDISRGTTVRKSPAWTSNASTFEKAPLSEVIGELERQYGVSIDMSGIKGDPLFTGGFPHDNIDNALKAITIPLNLGYHSVSPRQFKVFIRED